MARYTGPSFRKSRRLGFSLSETGKELARRPYKPGQHGKGRQAKVSEYGIQLAEKQKVRFMYEISEKQLKKIFEKAGKMQGVHGENLFKLLESRLDNVVYRMGLANTRRASRQVVNHGHILVNNIKVNIPSYKVKPGDVITVKEASREHKAIKEALEKNITLKDFVSFDKSKMSGVYIRLPERSELNQEINAALIVEFYSR